MTLIDNSHKSSLFDTPEKSPVLTENLKISSACSSILTIQDDTNSDK